MTTTAITTPTVERFTVRMVPNPAPTVHQPWLPSAAPELPALVNPDGTVHSFLGAGVPVHEAAAKAEAKMARWATPRHVVSRKDDGTTVELTAVVGEVVG